MHSKLQILWALYDVTVLPGNPSMPPADESLRIDRWLFYCRFFKTRVLATAAVTGGHVKLNGERTTPGSRVKQGDRVDLIRARLSYSMEVIEIPARRGPAAEAKSCYCEDEETIREREKQIATLQQDRMLMPKTKGRPDKHTRRKLRDRGRS
jgi:ribosome-associated heat shock protein Hsp15